MKMEIEKEKLKKNSEMEEEKEKEGKKVEMVVDNYNSIKEWFKWFKYQEKKEFNKIYDLFVIDIDFRVIYHGLFSKSLNPDLKD